jgi:pantoate--beta-alanine ligase
VSLLHFTQSRPMAQWIQDARSAGHSIGFVPTMGALHEGHISLVNNAMAYCSKIVVSIFVNPTQFNDPQDLLKYPKTLGGDLEMLLKCPCDLVFAPLVEEIYPKGLYKDNWDLGKGKEILEGEFRPGHFDGVLTVVDRLFELVGPDMAFFGEKDFQQQWLIKKMAENQGNRVKVISFPTIREENGLAMSSRNRRLSPEMKETATKIVKTLIEMKRRSPVVPYSELETWAKNELHEAGVIDVEYLRIVKTSDLLSPNSDQQNEQCIALVAAWIGGVRLLDNMILN